METNLIDSIPNMFTGAKPAQAELDELMNYVRKAQGRRISRRLAAGLLSRLGQLRHCNSRRRL